MSPDVKCAYSELVQIKRVIPNPRNPNTHPKRQIELLAKIIDFQGWRAPITVSSRSGFIVRGHGRYEAAKLLSETVVPVDYQDYDDEAQEWADLIADNRIAELAEINDELLGSLLEDLKTLDFDIELSGFLEDQPEIDLGMPFGDDMLPESLEKPEIMGEDSRTGRFIFPFASEDEKIQLEKRLGIDGKKTIYTLKDLSNA